MIGAHMKLFRLVMLFFCILFDYSQILASKDGLITIITEPTGVEVWLGNRFIGNTPIKEKLIAPGKYEIRLIDPIQKITAIEEVHVDEGRTAVVEKKMIPKYGNLMVKSIPENATVYLTVPLGKTPLYNEFVIPGKYHLEIRHPDSLYKNSERQVIVSEGETVELIDTLIMKKRKIFDKKALVRIGLGAGAAAAFICAILENGHNHRYKGSGRLDEAHTARVRRNLGIIGGGVCVVAFEILAFF